MADTVAAPPLVLIVTGAPASGKSMLGPPLARALGLPYLSKDRFKEALFDTLGYSDRAWSQRLGAASMRLLFNTTSTLLEAGQSLAVEANFWPELSTPEFQALAERYGCPFIQVLCTAASTTLAERFARRVHSGERHPGHADAEALADWQPFLAQPWPAMQQLPGPIITVETDGQVDVTGLVARISALIEHV